MSGRYCILCFHDDASGLEARAALLEEEGHFLIAVSCPLRALEFDVSQFHLAILDFDMPDGVARDLNALQLSTKGHLCLQSQELQGK